MAMLMYAPTDKLTSNVMIPYLWKEMNNITATSGRFAERADGIGDAECEEAIVFTNQKIPDTGCFSYH